MPTLAILDPPRAHGNPSKDFERKLIERVATENDLAPGVAENIINELARIMGSNGRNLSNRQVAERWELAEEKVQQISRSIKGDIPNLRAQASTRCLIVASILQDELLERLMDPEERKKIPAEKLPKMLRDAVDAGVTLQDGHQPAVSFNVGEMMSAMKRVEELKKVV